MQENGLMGHSFKLERKAYQVNKRNYFEKLGGPIYFKQWDPGGIFFVYVIKKIVSTFRISY